MLDIGSRPDVAELSTAAIEAALRQLDEALAHREDAALEDRRTRLELEHWHRGLPDAADLAPDAADLMELQ